MAIQATVKFEGVAPLANAYVRLSGLSLKKARTSAEDNKHYLIFNVSVYVNAQAATDDPEGRASLNCRDLKHFKVYEVDPAANLSALAYNTLKAKIVALNWEANTGAIEDV